jgi:hypothetical protein
LDFTSQTTPFFKVSPRQQMVFLHKVLSNAYNNLPPKVLPTLTIIFPPKVLPTLTIIFPSKSFQQQQMVSFHPSPFSHNKIIKSFHPLRLMRIDIRLLQNIMLCIPQHGKYRPSHAPAARLRGRSTFSLDIMHFLPFLPSFSPSGHHVLMSAA